MNKWLDNGIRILDYLLLLGLIVSFLMFCAPLVYGFTYFIGDMKDYILNDSDFLMPVTHHVASQAAIASFPTGIYTILVSVGAVLTVVGAILTILSLRAILANILEQNYFSLENVQLFKRMIKAQLWVIAGSVINATANQLTASWLYRINNGDFNDNWTDVFSALVTLVIYGIIYTLYARAVAMKAENDLII